MSAAWSSDEWDLNGLLALRHIPETCYWCDEEGTEPVWMPIDADGNPDEHGTDYILYAICKFHVADAGYYVAEPADWPPEWHPERFN